LTAVREVCSAKAEVAAAHVDELFKTFDTDSSGALNEDQVGAALAGIGLPPDNEQIRGVLLRHDVSGDGQLQREEFASLLRETWGGEVHLDIRRDLHQLYPAGEGQLEEASRTLAWVGRSNPTHFLLRALRHMWPEHVEHVAIMRNRAGNAMLDPDLMDVFDETFVPTVAPEVETAVLLAAEAAKQPPTTAGGFVVRLRLTGGKTAYAPLLGLPENRSSFRVDAKTSGFEWFVRFGGPGAFAMIVILYLVGKKRDAEEA
jgi:hypothetical protein